VTLDLLTDELRKLFGRLARRELGTQIGNRLRISAAGRPWRSRGEGGPTRSGGVPAGARNPLKIEGSKPGMPPASATVGRSGKMGERLLLPSPRARILPAFTCGSTC